MGRCTPPMVGTAWRSGVGGWRSGSGGGSRRLPGGGPTGCSGSGKFISQHTRIWSHVSAWQQGILCCVELSRQTVALLWSTPSLAARLGRSGCRPPPAGPTWRCSPPLHRWWALTWAPPTRLWRPWRAASPPSSPMPRAAAPPPRSSPSPRLATASWVRCAPGFPICSFHALRCFDSVTHSTEGVSRLLSIPGGAMAACEARRPPCATPPSPAPPARHHLGR